MTTTQPIPKDLREQLSQRIATMSEENLVELHDLMLLTETLRVRREISDQAEREQAARLWDDLPGIIAAYRARRKSA